MRDSCSKNEIISVMLNICTRVISLIFVIAMLFGSASWSKESIQGIIFIGLVSGLSFGLFYVKKNMTRMQTFLFYVLYFLILNVTLFAVSIKLGWIQKELASCLRMEMMFVMVFFGVCVLMYLVDFNEAKKINQKLKDRKNRLESEKD